MLEKQGRSSSLTAIETRNAMRADTFRGLAENIPLWRFRDVLVKLGTELGLSGGAVVYALDLMGLLTEADWRGDGRAVTFHSLRTYARKVGKSERTICEYERQLVAAGLAHRTVKHARRHGGYGSEARRTGLDWRSFGALMPELLQRLEKRAAMEEHRLDLEARIRSIRRIVLGMLDDIVERAGEGADEFVRTYASLDVARLRATLSVPELERRLGDLSLLHGKLETVFLETHDALQDRTAGDNGRIHAQGADQSEDSGCLIDITDKTPCPADIRKVSPSSTDPGIQSGRYPEKDGGLETMPRNRQPATGHQAPHDVAEKPEDAGDGVDAIPLEEIWKAAPWSWKRALGGEVELSWPVLIEVARHLVPQLGVSPYAWNRALRVLGPRGAALALMVLDRNRDHPLRPVMSVGGALVGMTRRAAHDGINIAPSLYGIMARPPVERNGGCSERRTA